jgi:signal transduction histidine kinase
MSLKILHLEDNILDAELVEANLLMGDFTPEILRVETREEFVAAIENGDFDLIFADYSLPSFDGLGALEIACDVLPDVPFIIISGALGEETAIETLKSGATDYILKHRLERLVPAVKRSLRETLERRRRERAEREREEMLEREQEARRKAEEANRLKDEFLATVSHELRTPLNAILGWATMLRRGQLDAENSQQAVEIIERNARAQVQLVEDLLDVSRIITGKLRLDVELVDLLSVLDNAIEAIRPAADAKGIQIEKQFDASADTVCGDANRLQQIIWNLLSNAVKFTPSGGAVRIRLQKLAGSVEIQIQDSGEGISPEFLPFVFDRFRQADGATTRIHSGLGLGLAIVKHLVEMHGGEVRAASDGAGKGATFTVSLPQQTLATKNGFDKPETTANGAAASQEKMLEGLHVLAVDDDSDSRDMLQIILEQHGARVTTAASAAEALEKIQNVRADVLVSDVGMPGEDGYSLMTKVRALALDCRAVPSIALTGFAREEDNERAISAGFNKHVAKPVDPGALVREIAALAKRSPSNIGKTINS